MRLRSIPAALVLLAAFADPAAAEPIFPAYGLDSASLGRGGTVVAAAGGASSAFGNPATLRPYGSILIGADVVRTRQADKSSWALRATDSQSPVRGTLMYVADPSFAGFEEDLWALGLAQSLGSWMIVGEGFRTGKYLGSDGRDETLQGADLGVVVALGRRASVGFVSRNIYSSDESLAPRIQGSGLLVHLPWTVDLSADFEKVEGDGAYPSLLTYGSLAADKSEFRAGMEFSPLSSLTARLGWIAPSENPVLYTAGLTYGDQSGTLDAAIAYDPEDGRTVVVTFGITLGR